MSRRLAFVLSRQILRSSSTSTGLKAGQVKNYPKVDATSLVSTHLDAMVGEIHKELQDELRESTELGDMAK